MAEVYRQSFWMMHYGAGSPKRTTVWANTACIAELDVSALSLLLAELAVVWEDSHAGAHILMLKVGSPYKAGTLPRRLRENTIVTAHRYTDSSGRKRCVGSKALKSTQPVS